MDSIAESKLNCVQCGYNLTGVAVGGGCPECGEAIERSLEAFPVVGGGVPRTSGAAVASLVLGICSLLFTMGCGILAAPIPVVAVVLGHVACRQIAARPRSLHGRGLATAGLVTGYISLAFMAIFGVVMVFATANAF